MPRPLAGELDRTALTCTGTAAIAAGFLLAQPNLPGDYRLLAEQDGDIVRPGSFLLHDAVPAPRPGTRVRALRGLQARHRDRIARAGSTGHRVVTVGACHGLIAALYLATPQPPVTQQTPRSFFYQMGFMPGRRWAHGWYVTDLGLLIGLDLKGPRKLPAPPHERPDPG